MDLVSAVTQKCISTWPNPWHSHLLLRAPLKTSQTCVLKNEVKRVTLIPAGTSVPPRELSQVCVCVSVSPGTCVQGGWCQISVVAHSPACPIDPHSLSSRDTEQVWALVLCFSVSPLLNLHLRFHQRNHSDLSQQDFLNQQRRGRVWAVLHSSWWNVIWWYRELNTVILNLGTTRDCFLFLTSRF